MKNKHLLYYLSPLAAVTLLSACDSDNSKSFTVPMSYSYQVEVTNLTNAQPASPVAAVLHNEGQLWMIGSPASSALENMAESGDNSGILASSIALASSSSDGVLLPGMKASITVMASGEQPQHLSVATMLVNTNDAFTGINALDISTLALNESISLFTSSYDAGTEKNSEMNNTIPGPADNGEGFNEIRDDVNVVAMHPGVVGQDDGLTNSVLSSVHKFDNPTLAIKVTRIK